MNTTDRIERLRAVVGRPHRGDECPGCGDYEFLLARFDELMASRECSCLSDQHEGPRCRSALLMRWEKYSANAEGE
jgi:hypothetical protein